MGKQEQEAVNLATVVVTAIMQLTKFVLDNQYVTSVISWVTLLMCVEATKLQL